MAGTFNLLRANDLIWSFVVNNYLLGQGSVPVRPAVLELGRDAHAGEDAHASICATCTSRTCCASRAASRWRGVPIDLSKVNVPPYFISTVEDHIAPWKTTYAGARLLRRHRSRFVLGGSGHIAGIVNPPAANKYQLLDRRQADRHRRRMARQRQAQRRLVVGRVEPLGKRLRRRQSCRARTGRQGAERARRRARLLREIATRPAVAESRAEPSLAVSRRAPLRHFDAIAFEPSARSGARSVCVCSAISNSSRHRRAEQIALHLVATFLSQESQLSRCLYSFGQDLQIRAAAHRDDRSRQRACVSVRLQILHERTIDLDAVRTATA